MKIFTTVLAVGFLVLISTLPANAQTELAPPQKGQSTFASSKESYLQKARDDMREWQQKLQKFGEQEKTAGEKAERGARNDLNEAKARADAALRKLETVGNDGWEEAKHIYEEAARELAATWRKYYPEEK